MRQVVAKQEGYAYIFVSKENPTKVDIHFDDLKITHSKTNVIQYNEYYPFGLQTSTSWTRENTKDNNYLYNAANELNKTSGWYEMFYRGYDPAIGRMLQVDPYATSYASFTTYNYAVNNPVMMNDPSGGQVSVVGYTDSQLHTMYRQNRYNGGPADFSEWAINNLDGRDAGDRNINGGDGNNYAFDIGGALVVGGVWVEYTIGLSNGKGGFDQIFAQYTTFEANGKARFEPNSSDSKDSYNFQVLHASKEWDWFIEKTTQGNSVKITAVIITYNTNKKDMWSKEYGKMVNFFGATKIVTTQADGTVTTNYTKFDPTDNMNQWIFDAKDYHNGYWLSSPTLWQQYIYFMTPKPEKVNRNKVISSKHR